jgi:hypothetical protein
MGQVVVLLTSLASPGGNKTSIFIGDSYNGYYVRL